MGCCKKLISGSWWNLQLLSRIWVQLLILMVCLHGSVMGSTPYGELYSQFTCQISLIITFGLGDQSVL